MDDISLFGDQDDLSDESQPHQGQALFQDIVALSDEEAVVPPEPVEAVVPHEGRRKRQKTVESRDLEIASERLNLVVRSNCKCKNPDCRVPFREPHEFEKLLKLRMKLQGMEKQVMDQEAWVFKKAKRTLMGSCSLVFILSHYLIQTPFSYNFLNLTNDLSNAKALHSFQLTNAIETNVLKSCNT